MVSYPLHFLHVPWKIAIDSIGGFRQLKKNGPPVVEWNVVPVQDQVASILYGVTFFGALSLKLTVNLLSVNEFSNSNRKPICSEFQAPFTLQSLPSGVLLHCLDILISSNSSRIWSNAAMTLANSLDLLFVTPFQLAAGRSSNVLFMNVFDKSMSALLVLIVVVAAIGDSVGRKRCR